MWERLPYSWGACPRIGQCRTGSFAGKPAPTGWYVPHWGYSRASPLPHKPVPTGIGPYFSFKYSSCLEIHIPDPIFKATADALGRFVVGLDLRMGFSLLNIAYEDIHHEKF